MDSRPDQYHHSPPADSPDMSMYNSPPDAVGCIQYLVYDNYRGKFELFRLESHADALCDEWRLEVCRLGCASDVGVDHVCPKEDSINVIPLELQ